jgi:hypothetical protein
VPTISGVVVMVGRLRLTQPTSPEIAAYTAFTTTRSPSRGFGIGHICQLGV